MAERTLRDVVTAGLHPWRSAAGVAALVLIAGQLAWRAVILGRGYFTQDDFMMLTLGGRPLSVDLLLRDYTGHLFPGDFLIAWLHSHLAPLDWGVAVVEIVTLQLVASLLAWVVLCRLVPASWWRLPVLAVYLFCPLSLWPTQWWAVAIQFLPVSIFLFVATWALLHRIQEGSRWSGPLVVLSTFAGLLFQERAVLYPVVLGFVAVALADAVGVRRVLVALRDHLMVWVALVLLLTAYFLVHRELAPIESASPGSAAASAELMGNFVARNAVPGYVGGPWTDPGTNTIVVPAGWAVAVSWLVVVLLAGLTMRRSRSAVWGWLLLLVYTLADGVLLFGGRTDPAFGAALGLIPRYSAGVVPAALVAIALIVGAAVRRPATSPAPVPTTRWRRPLPLALALTGCYLASSAITTALVVSYSYNEDDRAYVEALRADLTADPRAVVFDGAPPDGVMVAWFGDLARVSNVVGTAPEDPVFDVPTYHLRIVDPAGRLRPVALVGIVSDDPTRDRRCVHPVTARQVTSIELADDSGRGKQVARISYYTVASGFLVVATPGGEVSLPLREDLNVADLVVHGPLDRLEMRLEIAADEPREATVCVVDVTVGYPAPG